MRIVFINMHASWMLLKVLDTFLFKNSVAVKHGYILKYLLNHPEYEVCNYINDRGFSLAKGDSLLSRTISKFARLEHKFILKKNGIDSKKIHILKNINEIRNDDIVMVYNFYSNQFRDLNKIHAFKALSFLHFHGFREDIERIKAAQFDCYFNEVNLQKSSELFRKFYHVDLPWIIIPFVYAPRFKNITPFGDRKNKAFSVGTITYKEHSEYFEVYDDACLQPIRKMIKDNPEYFCDTIDCYSEDYLEGFVVKKVTEKDNIISSTYKKIYNRLHTGKQKKYFSFNMVDKFNEYKMHIVGEERIGLPGIGFVEGMACGSAYIGIDSSMYRDYGLIPGVHYITYDGTKEGLRHVIEYYQRDENQDELERIAKTGCEFVRAKFQGDTVAESLIKEIVKMKEHKLSSINNIK